MDHGPTMDWCRIGNQGCHRSITAPAGRPYHHTAMSVILVSAVTACSLLAVSLVSAGTPPPHTLEEASHRLDMILNNTRSRENYIRCFMDRGICNKDALSIKRILTEALSSNCSNCTQAQRLGADRFFQYLQSSQPETWSKLRGKYGKEEEEDDDDESEDSDDDDDRPSQKSSHQPPAKLAEPGASTEKSAAAGAAQANATLDTTTISMIF